jgi:phosphatidylglycerol:prolipoprotein diacylglycerol transferase
MYPILFTIPGIDLPIHSYGLLLGIAVVTGWLLIRRNAATAGISHANIDRLVAIGILGGLLGARMLHIALAPRFYSIFDPLSFLLPSRGGMVAYGGFLGGAVAIALTSRRMSLAFSAIADLFVPSIAAGLGITRIGCLLYGCDHGAPVPASAPAFVHHLGIRFPDWHQRFPGLQHHVDNGLSSLQGAPAYLLHLHEGLIAPGATESLAVYPTQILFSLNGWIAFALLLVLSTRRNRFTGQLFLAFTMYYGFTRALLECLRGDVDRGMLAGLSVSQWIGIVTAVVAACFYRRWRPDRNAVAPQSSASSLR